MDDVLRSQLAKSLAETANRRSLQATRVPPVSDFNEAPSIPSFSGYGIGHSAPNLLHQAISLSHGEDEYEATATRESKKRRREQVTEDPQVLIAERKPSNDKDPKMKFTCIYPGCNKKFKWHWTMQMHSKTHLGDAGRLFKCDVCNAGFFTAVTLRSHRKTHDRTSNDFKCTECEKTYGTAEGLSLHIKNHHSTDRQWKCESCPKAFVRYADLKLHVLRKHAVNRPFPCVADNCGKTFACATELKRHLKMHSKDVKALEALEQMNQKKRKTTV